MKNKTILIIVKITAILFFIGVLVIILYNAKSKFEPSGTDENKYGSESGSLTIEPFDVLADEYEFDPSPFEAGGYLRYIEKFSRDEKLDSVSDVNDLVNQIETIWIRIYGDRIKEERPYKVFYDKNHGIWMVKGSLKENVLGGEAYALIADGSWEVLAIWHDK